jgi:hypothetical protein
MSCKRQLLESVSGTTTLRKDWKNILLWVLLQRLLLDLRGRYAHALPFRSKAWDDPLLVLD